MSPLLSPEEFIARLRAEAALRYHDKHSFHVAMHSGTLTRRQIQAWVANQFYYQSRRPIKDALIVAKSDDPAWRRLWIRRICDSDGLDAAEGTIEKWLRLAESVGLARADVEGQRMVLPAVRFACDAYVQLVRERSLVEAVASSLTGYFSADLLSTRIAAWDKHYAWAKSDVHEFFRSRVPRVRRDAEEALEFVLQHARTRSIQEKCVQAFITKCEILWAILDAVSVAYGLPLAQRADESAKF